MGHGRRNRRGEYAGRGQYFLVHVAHGVRPGVKSGAKNTRCACIFHGFRGSEVPVYLPNFVIVLPIAHSRRLAAEKTGIMTASSKTILPAVLGIILLLGSACTHYYYAPNTLQTPFLQQRHDTRVSVGAISGDEFSGFEAHAVYSPVKFGALMFNYFSAASNGAGDPSADWGKGNMAEIALGAYYPLGKYVSISCFGGIGRGKVLNHYEDLGRSDLRFRRTFLEPALSVQYRWLRLGLAYRLSRLEYLRGYIDYSIGEPHLGIIEAIERNSPLWMPEFGFNFGFGTRPFWVSFYLNYNYSHLKDELYFTPLSTGISFSFELDYLWRPKEQK